jgi:hypothetical protein
MLLQLQNCKQLCSGQFAHDIKDQIHENFFTCLTNVERTALHVLLHLLKKNSCGRLFQSAFFLGHFEHLIILLHSNKLLSSTCTSAKHGRRPLVIDKKVIHWNDDDHVENTSCLQNWRN